MWVWPGINIFYGIGLWFFWMVFGRFCLGFGVCLCWLGGVCVFFFGVFFFVFDYFVVLYNNFCVFNLYLVLSHLFEIHIFLLC